MSMTIPALTPFPRMRSPFAVLWTREDCEKLEADGHLTYRYELVEGDIINKMGQNIPHRTAVTLVISWLVSVMGPRYVQSQSAIDVAPEDNPTSEPEPDVALLSVPLQTLTQNPTAEQVRLVVEVSDSTLAYDLGVKAGLYARAGIDEYWVVDLNARMIHVHRHPQNGQYPPPTTFRENDTLSCLAVPTATTTTASLLP